MKEKEKRGESPDTFTKPRHYQVVGVRKIDGFDGRALLADDMGLGKTLQALRYAKFFLPKGSKVVVVCPAGVKYSWEREAEKHVGMKAVVLEGMQSPKRQHKLKDSNLYVIGYNTLGDPDSNKRTWLKFLRRRVKPALVVIDEPHYIMNPTTIRSRAVCSLCDDVDKIVALGGTPLVNTPAEMWVIVNLLRPGIFGRSFFSFAHKYCRPKRTPWGWTFKGAKNLKRLHRLLRKHVMIRRRKVDVLKELPKKTEIIVPVEINGRREYDQAANDFINWVKTVNVRKLKFAERNEALSKVNHLKGLVCRLKLDAVTDWIKTFLETSDGKLVVFGTRNKDLLVPLFQRFEQHSLLITGRVRGRERQRRIDRFVDDKSKRIIFANMFAAGVGINGLQHASHTACFVDQAWTPAAHDQASARLDRLGQTMPVSVYWLIARDTLEERILETQHGKQAVIEQVLDGKDEQTAASGSVFETFLKSMSDSQKPSKRRKKGR